MSKNIRTYLIIFVCVILAFWWAMFQVNIETLPQEEDTRGLMLVIMELIGNFIWVFTVAFVFLMGIRYLIEDGLNKYKKYKNYKKYKKYKERHNRRHNRNF